MFVRQLPLRSFSRDGHAQDARTINDQHEIDVGNLATIFRSASNELKGIFCELLSLDLIKFNRLGLSEALDKQAADNVPIS
jgi:hypothetical protein